MRKAPRESEDERNARALAKLARHASAAGTQSTTPGEHDYTAASIEVLEGLEPVRRRPVLQDAEQDLRRLHHVDARERPQGGHAGRRVRRLSQDARERVDRVLEVERLHRLARLLHHRAPPPERGISDRLAVTLAAARLRV